MTNQLAELFTTRELATLAAIVQVGDAAYRELMNIQSPLFGHPYFADTRGRIRTKLVQMQCEIESHDPKFPFELVQREFQCKQVIPELRNGKAILHIARSASPDVLPPASKYKKELSQNNRVLPHQMLIDFDRAPHFVDAPYYGFLTFGGRKQTFSLIQFPDAKYRGIAASLYLPQIIMDDKNAPEIERKKAALKRQFLVQNAEGGIS